MKIIIEKTQRKKPIRYDRDWSGSKIGYYDNCALFETITYYNVYVNETNKENFLGEFQNLVDAEKIANVFHKAEKAEVVTSWTQPYRVTTTIYAHSESEALDRLCGDDMEARAKATVVIV